MDSAPVYSVPNGQPFGGSSLTGDLRPGRVQLLKHHLCGKQILGAGCGRGAFVEFLCARWLQVTGMDCHEIFLDIARQRPGATGTYIQGDIIARPSSRATMKDAQTRGDLSLDQRPDGRRDPV